MALGNCDACGENPVNYMLSNVDNGNTQGLCQWCLIVFIGQLAGQLGLIDAPAEPDADQSADGAEGEAPTPAPKSGRAKRAAAPGVAPTPDAAPDQEETPEPAAADAG